MKKVILSIAILSSAFAFAQTKEIAAAYKAIDAGDIATANSQLSAADAALGGKTYLLDPQTLEQYYYAKGISLIKSGKQSEGAAYLAKIRDLSSNKIYYGKDSSKNKVYYVGKAAADQSGVSGLKEEIFVPTTSAKVANAINPLLQATNKAAVEAYNAKNYQLAGDKFKETYFLLKAAGTDDKSILMNAATAYGAGNKSSESIDIYNDLINSGYTGVEQVYNAKNKKSGQVEKLDKNTYEFYKKLGASSDFTDFTVTTSPSVEKELYQINAKNLFNAKRYDEALALTEKGLAKFPNDSGLMNIRGLAYYNSGRSAEFIEILKKQIANNPSDFESWYNLGVMQKNNPAMMEEAKKSFLKALEIKPGYVPALQNLTYITMGDDEKAVDEYNAAKKAGKQDLANKIIEARRLRFAAALPYAEKWYAAEPDNLDVVSLLKGFYTSAKNEAKVAEFKAKEAALQKK